MNRRKTIGADPAQALRAIALRYPEVQEGIACKGTALESTSYQVRKKAFLFVSGAREPCTIRLKLTGSLEEVSGLAKKEPGRYRSGAHSSRSIAPRKLVETLPA